ncbi:phosphodiester glycosidase family protein [bacterium]|nr:MAG: phosphodiester glycosidase family protein [bacterium]
MTAMLAAVLIAAPRQEAGKIGYRVLSSGGHRYHVVQADTTEGFVSTRTVIRNGRVSPWSFVKREQPRVMMTGTFFAMQNGTPVADVLVDGLLKARGNRGSALGIRPDGTIAVWDKPFKRKEEWEGFEFGLRGGVRVVTKGIVHPNPKAQRFKDPAIWGKAARTAVGLTKQGKLVLVATKERVTLTGLGRAMVKAGVREGLALDGGGSACLYVDGKMVVPTARPLSNMLVLSESAVAMR